MSISRVEILKRARTISSSKSEYGLLEVQFLSRSVPHGAPDASYENSLQSKTPEKSQRSNSGDGGNTGDGGKTVGEAIEVRGSGIGDSLLVALYACITFIYGSSWKGEMVSEAERSLDESFE
ncbi:hypothetical protein Tco_0073007, partial [Tanacetum coccineum]